MPRCVALKDNGTRCKCNAITGSEFCGTHQDWTAVFQVSKSSFKYEEEFIAEVTDIAPYKPAIRSISCVFNLIGR